MLISSGWKTRPDSIYPDLYISRIPTSMSLKRGTVLEGQQDNGGVRENGARSMVFLNGTLRFQPIPPAGPWEA